MSSSSARLVFSFLCALAFCAVLLGAWWELARFRRAASRGESSLPARQLRLRLMSAALWMAIFVANGYAVAFLWPDAAPRSPELKAQARLFLLVVGGSFALILPALVLLIMDFLQTSRLRREQMARLQGEMADFLRQESTRAKTQPVQIQPLQTQPEQPQSKTNE